MFKELLPGKTIRILRSLVFEGCFAFVGGDWAPQFLDQLPDVCFKTTRTGFETVEPDQGDRPFTPPEIEKKFQRLYRKIT